MNNLLIIYVVMSISGVWFGYNLGSSVKGEEFEAYKLQAEQSYNALLKQRLQRDAQYAAKINALEKEHADTVSDLKAQYDATIADMRKSFKPSGVHQCGSSKSGGDKRQADNTRGLICYTTEELHSRIESTLAIGHECDVLRIRYKTLLSLIEEYNAKK